MKKLTVISITMLLACVILFSCKKSSSSSNSTSGSYSLVFNGAASTGETYECEIQNDSFLLIGASSTGVNPTIGHPSYSFAIELIVPSTGVTTGTYIINKSGFNILDFGIAESTNPTSSYHIYLTSQQYPQTTGTVIIDSFNTTTKYIHCTFSGTLQNTLNLQDSTAYSVSGNISGIVQSSNQ